MKTLLLTTFTLLVAAIATAPVFAAAEEVEPQSSGGDLCPPLPQPICDICDSLMDPCLIDCPLLPSFVCNLCLYIHCPDPCVIVYPCTIECPPMPQILCRICSLLGACMFQPELEPELDAGGASRLITFT